MDAQFSLDAIHCIIEQWTVFRDLCPVPSVARERPTVLDEEQGAPKDEAWGEVVRIPR